jgi:hypothetical protein
MPIEVRDDREAQVLAGAINDGKITGAQREEAMLALRAYLAVERPPLTPETTATRFFSPSEFEDPEVLQGRQEIAAVPQVVEGAISGADATAGVANAAVAEIFGGFNAFLANVFTKDNDKANQVLENVSDTLTIFPISEGGNEALQAIAPPLVAFERGIHNLSDAIVREVSGNEVAANPLAATMVKTALLGGLELAPSTPSTMNVTKAGVAIRKREKEIRRIAEGKGINLDLKNFSDDLAEAAQRLTPDERAQNAPILIEGLKDAKKRDFEAKEARFEELKTKRTYLESGSIEDLSDFIFERLVENGTDFKELPALLTIVDDMKQIRTRIPGVPGVRGERVLPVSAVNLNQLEILRKRTNSTYQRGTPGSVKMGVIRKEIDRFLENEIHKTTIDAGRIARGEAAIWGDADGVQALKDARLAHANYKKNFSEDKTIARLIEEDATPEQYSRWLMGASSVNAKPQAALTIRRIKEVLGDNSPGVEGIRQDFLFEMYEPLLKEDPNFSQFVRNYDTMIRRNPSLVKELGLDKDAMKDMHDFAKVQSKLPPAGKIFTKGDIVTGVTRMAVGHQIAKAAVRVEFSRRLANAVAGVDAVTPKQIISDIMDIKFDAPMIPKKSTVAAEFVAGAAISSLEEEE